MGNTVKQYVEAGHNYVDLGLSAKWATCNIGATTPEGFGDYFSWGETEVKERYSRHNYKWAKGVGIYGFRGVMPLAVPNKYNHKDCKFTLDLEDDAAHALWGGSWRMPTKEEIEELIANCSFSEVIVNDIKCYKISSKKEGYTDSHIFLPASGYQAQDMNKCFLSGVNSYYYYWTNTLSDAENSKGCCLYIPPLSQNLSIVKLYRFHGLPIRPVFK